MKDKIITYSFVIFISILSLLGIIFKDKDISITERRKLSTFPKFELTNEYITKLDKYFLDQFPYRDSFRSIKAHYNYDILHKYDNNGIYVKDDKVFKSIYPINNKSLSNFVNKTNKVLDLLTSDNNKYFLLVPDKNYYLNDPKFLNIDYDYIFNEIKKLDINFIDIREDLNLEDFYNTDTHWKQENLDKIIKKLSINMNFDYEKPFYNKNTYDNFKGVYYGESALKLKEDTITYLSNTLLDNIEVNYLENPTLHTIYNEENLHKLDPYNVYLDGPSSYIEITNPFANNDKELIIFRDSFGSSLTPLLVNYYKKITVIDNRYISLSNILDKVEFKDQDILFIYSTLIVNKSFTLKG